MSSQPVLADGGTRHLLMGNEAIARGAIEAGVQLVAAYPGTPSSEICEVLIDAAPHCDYYVEWSTNEKIAFEMAAGASLVGARSIVAMKNAGLNVAMDTFMTLPYGGVKGGMVIVVADDPAAHYSSTEQDTRFAAAYAEIPCLEPMDQQEALEMTKAAFEISEEMELPVFLRSVSRISHASGDVLLGDLREERNQLGFNKHYKLPFRWNVYGPPGALEKHKWLHSILPKAKELSNISPFNKLNLVPNSKTAIVMAGIGAAYGIDALRRIGLADQFSTLKLGMVYPLAEKLVDELLEGVDTLIVIEEGDPVVENQIRAYVQSNTSGLTIYGKSINKILNPYGELNADVVSEALAGLLGIEYCGDVMSDVRQSIIETVTPRSSTLCAGCSHLGTYAALKQVLKKYPGINIINGDIGCYEQGGYGVAGTTPSPNDDESKKYPNISTYEMLDTIHVMGSGIGLAQGQAHVGYSDGKILAVAGDSTFIHAVLPSVVNCVYSEADITFLVLDNRWTCMTGHQPNPNTGLSSLGEPRERLDLEKVVRAFGVNHVMKANAYDLECLSETIHHALEHKGISIVIVEGECMLQVQRRNRTVNVKTHVIQDKCIGCRACVNLGCPAVTFDKVKRKAGIDPLTCTDCGLCSQICPVNAISKKGRD
ncbi:MAG TPA: indolepyruvate ferredoxin oxidoreductase subunit alpha [Clostridiaceae bacterium]|nr:indolepyruvate ferredoxin oxidoreductase subunit alpha [Clostridiaceae bacterium]